MIKEDLENMVKNCFSALLEEIKHLESKEEIVFLLEKAIKDLKINYE